MQDLTAAATEVVEAVAATATRTLALAASASVRESALTVQVAALGELNRRGQRENARLRQLVADLTPPF